MSLNMDQILGRVRRERVGFWRGLWNRLRFGNRQGVRVTTYYHNTDGGK